MSRFLRFFPLLSLLLASLACSLPGAVRPSTSIPAIEIPTFTPTTPADVKPTEPPAPPTFTPEPTALLPQARIIDPRALSGCDIFLDTDFPNAVGAVPVSAQILSDMEKKACQYSFANGTLFAGIFTSLPGREAFENVRQFDAMTGGVIEPLPLGEIAIFKVFAEENRVVLEVVLKGWYIVLDGTDLDRKHLLLLAELLANSLVQY
ncbi:MAG: hypothetical protein AB1509_08665 [Chloroflexota bacterium]